MFAKCILIIINALIASGNQIEPSFSVLNNVFIVNKCLLTVFPDAGSLNDEDLSISPLIVGG